MRFFGSQGLYIQLKVFYHFFNHFFIILGTSEQTIDLPKYHLFIISFIYWLLLGESLFGGLPGEVCRGDVWGEVCQGRSARGELPGRYGRSGEVRGGLPGEVCQGKLGRLAGEVCQVCNNMINWQLINQINKLYLYSFYGILWSDVQLVIKPNTFS